jgi:hypothetical protein
MITAIIAGGVPKSGGAEAAADDSLGCLAKWHHATQRAAIREAGRTEFRLPYPLAENFVQLSYLIRHAKDERVPDGKGNRSHRETEHGRARHGALWLEHVLSIHSTGDRAADRDRSGN